MAGELQATIQGSSEVGHRASVRRDEYVRLIPIQPDAEQPVVRYDLDTAQPGHHPGGAAPSLANLFSGKVESPETSYSLESATSTNPAAETEIVATHEESEQHLWHSSRALQVTRWRSVYGPPYNYDVDWLNRGPNRGFGRSLGQNERCLENLNLAAQFGSNPTLGGTHNDPGVEDLVQVRPSTPLHNDFAGGASGSAYSEGAGIPLQFDTDGNHEPTQGPFSGAAPDEAYLFWRLRQYGRVDPHFGARKFVHRITNWYFQPREWHEDQFGGMSSEQGANGARLRWTRADPAIRLNPVGFDRAYFFDAANETLTELSGFEDATPPSLWVALDSSLRYQRNLSGTPDDASPVPSGYAAAILRRSSDDFTVAIAARIEGNATSKGSISRSALPTSISILSGGSGELASPPYESNRFFRIALFCDSFAGRDEGWSGSVGYVFTGPFSEVQTALRELYTSGLLDVEPDEQLLPASVIEGTDLGVLRENPWNAIEPPWTDTAALAVGAEEWYVDPDTGSDANPGTQAQPFATIDEAWRNRRTPNAHAVIYLKAGAHFVGQGISGHNGKGGGASASQPVIITTYGGTANALLDKSVGLSSVLGPCDHVILENLDIIHDTPGSGRGIDCLGPADNWIVQNCKVSAFKEGMRFQVFDGPITNVTIRGCQSYDNRLAAPGTSGHTQGLFFSADVGGDVVVEFNMLDRNGYEGDPTIFEGATIFSHNAYFDGDENDTFPAGSTRIFRHNISARASSNGVQQRPGGENHSNLYIENSINLLVPSTWLPVQCRYNVVYGGKDVDGTTPRGWGYDIGVRDGNDVDLEDNLLLEQTNGTDSRGYIIKHHDEGPQTAPVIRARRNVGVNYAPIRWEGAAWGAGCVLEDHIAFEDADGTRDVAISGDSWAPNWAVDRTVLHRVGGDSTPTTYGGVERTVAEWGTDVGDGNVSSADPQFSDPTRNPLTYHDLKQSTTGSTVDDLLTHLRSIWTRQSWDPDYSAVRMGDWIRAGFDLPALEMQYEWAYRKARATGFTASVGSTSSSFQNAAAARTITPSSATVSTPGVVASFEPAAAKRTVVIETEPAAAVGGAVGAEFEVAAAKRTVVMDRDPPATVTDVSAGFEPAAAARTIAASTATVGGFLEVTFRDAAAVRAITPSSATVGTWLTQLPRAVRRRFAHKGPVIPARLIEGATFEAGGAMGVHASGLVRPLQPGDDFGGWAVDGPVVREGVVWVMTRSVVWLDVSGVDGPDEYEEIVVALGEDSFALRSQAPTGTPIGRVTGHVVGSTAQVYCEAASMRSLDS